MLISIILILLVVFWSTVFTYSCVRLYWASGRPPTKENIEAEAVLRAGGGGSYNELKNNNKILVNTIPKVIYQLTKEPIKEMHPAILKNIKELKDRNPGWDHCLMTFEEAEQFVKDNYPSRTLKAYRSINPDYPAAQSDFLRYLIIYQNGGVYLDDKSNMIAPLDEIIHESDEYLLSHWKSRESLNAYPSPYGELQQWHVISKPKHPFLKAVIDNVTHNIETYKLEEQGTGEAIFALTGPLAYNWPILSIFDQYPCRVLKNEAESQLVYNNLPGNYRKARKGTHYTLTKTPLVLKKL